MAMKHGKNNSRLRRGLKDPVSLVMLFYFLAFLLLFTRDGNFEAMLLAGVVPVIILIGTAGLPKVFPADRLLLSLTNFLCALGVLILYRMDPARGIDQAINYGVGVFCMLCCTVAVEKIRSWGFLCTVMMGVSAVLLAVPYLFGVEKNGAKAWIAVGRFSFQPSEIVKVCFLPVIAYLLSRRRLITCVIYTGACLLLLMLQQDLGTALIYYFTLLILVYTATGSLLLVGLGLLAGAGAAVAGYEMFSHVRVRVAMWQDPWQDPMGKGYQIVKGLLAMVNGGLFGMGLGQGNATGIPEAQNDYIFAVIMNEFGVLFGVIVVLMYILIVVRGAMIARRSTGRMYAMMAVGCVGMICIQAFVIIGGVIKLIPLTGVTLPFISSGGSSMVSSMAIIGLLQGVSARNKQRILEDEEIAGKGGRA